MKKIFYFLLSLSVIILCIYGLGQMISATDQRGGNFIIHFITKYFQLWSLIFSFMDDYSTAGKIGGWIIFIIFLGLNYLIYFSFKYIFDSDYRKEKNKE